MSNFIMVPVPEDRVQDVYSLLAKGPEQVQVSSDDELTDEWTNDDVRLAYSESPDTIKQVLRLLAESPGQPIHSDVLYTSIGRTRNQFSGIMGAFGKRVKNRYGKSTKPFKEGWDDKAGTMSYEMSEDVAAVIADGA